MFGIDLQVKDPCLGYDQFDPVLVNLNLLNLNLLLHLRLPTRVSELKTTIFGVEEVIACTNPSATTATEAKYLGCFLMEIQAI